MFRRVEVARRRLHRGWLGEFVGVGCVGGVLIDVRVRRPKVV